MKLKMIIFLFLILLTIPLGSCGSFTEMEDRYIVLGVAVDFDFDKKVYVITAEVVNVQDSSAGTIVSKYYTGSGRSMFDAIRNMIKISGKRLFWAHTKVLIINKELAAGGTYPILDWVNRDQEARDDMLIIISREKTAREIIECKSSKTCIPSNLIPEMVANYKSLPKYPKTDLWEFLHDLSTPGIEPVAPAIKVVEVDGERRLQIDGTAIFLEDSMVGFLGDYESMDFLFVRNKLEGGLIFLDKNITDLGADLTLEIFNSTTKVKPGVKEGKVVVEVIVKPRFGVAETDRDFDFTDMNLVEQLKKNSSSYLEKHIADTIKTLQEKYKSDIFGIGNKINISLPSRWRALKQDWSNNFSNLEISVTVDAEITGSGVVGKPLSKE